MKIQKFKVVFSGKIIEGEELENVKEKLAILYKTTIEKIEKYFKGNKLIVKDNLDFEECTKIQNTFLKRGAVCSIEPSENKAILLLNDNDVKFNQENKESFNINSVISNLSKEKSFPFVLLNIRNYNGFNFFVLIMFLVGCLYFGSGLIKLFSWQDKWYVPDMAVRTIYFLYHVFLFTTIYCFTWLVFDRKSIEGYVLSLFSIVFGIVYVISPVDFVPEAIPLIGSFDDLLVGFCSIMVGVRSYYNSKKRKTLSSEVVRLIENGKTEEALYLYLKSEGYNLRNEE